MRAAAQLDVDQPAERREPRVGKLCAFQVETRREQRLGQRGVVVGQDVFKPLPRWL